MEIVGLRKEDKKSGNDRRRAGEREGESEGKGGKQIKHKEKREKEGEENGEGEGVEEGERRRRNGENVSPQARPHRSSTLRFSVSNISQSQRGFIYINSKYKRYLYIIEINKKREEVEVGSTGGVKGRAEAGRGEGL